MNKLSGYVDSGLNPHTFSYTLMYMVSRRHALHHKREVFTAFSSSVLSQSFSSISSKDQWIISSANEQNSPLSVIKAMSDDEKRRKREPLRNFGADFKSSKLI